jgi:hypothetical protein
MSGLFRNYLIMTRIFFGFPFKKEMRLPLSYRYTMLTVCYDWDYKIPEYTVSESCKDRDWSLGDEFFGPVTLKSGVKIFGYPLSAGYWTRIECFFKC